MELPVGKKQGRVFWQAHVDACASYPGSMAAYCKENGLGKSRFIYYRHKFLAEKSKFAEVKARDERKPLVTPLARESSAFQQRLPDPKWVATLIRELSR
jgi:hypothetical protein